MGINLLETEVDLDLERVLLRLVYAAKSKFPSSYIELEPEASKPA